MKRHKKRCGNGKKNTERFCTIIFIPQVPMIIQTEKCRSYKNFSKEKEIPTLLLPNHLTKKPRKRFKNGRKNNGTFRNRSGIWHCWKRNNQKLRKKRVSPFPEECLKQSNPLLVFFKDIQLFFEVFALRMLEKFGSGMEILFLEPSPSPFYE